MTSVTFAVSKGGVGKSLITANVGAALAARGKKVIMIEGDPNRPLQTILGVGASPKHDLTLDEVVKKNAEIGRAMDPTEFDNLFLITSGVSLQDYFEIDPIIFARKLADLKTDYMFIDVPFPLGKAALLSLGICEYFIPILTEDEFVLCVESAIDTIRLGKYLLKCVPLGFILNRIKNPQKFNKDFVKDLEDLLEISCITRINEHLQVSKSYGGVESQKAFLAYNKPGEEEFSRRIDDVADFLEGERPKPEKKDSVELLQRILKP
jgi:septum site-determining protein MinD